MNGYSKGYMKHVRKLAHILLAILLAILALFVFTTLLGSSTVASGPARPARSVPGTGDVVNHVVSLPVDRTAGDYLVVVPGNGTPGPTPASTNTADGFSVAFWFKYSEKTLLDEQPIEYDTGLILAVGDDLKLEFKPSGDANRNINLALGFPNWEVTTWGNADGRRRTVLPNEWTHLAFVYDMAQGQIRFYFNGRLAVTATTAGTVSSSLNVEALEIGNPCCVGSAKGTLAFKIDDLVIYQGPLQDAEVAQLYSEPDPRLHQFGVQPAAYWSFEEQQNGQFVAEIGDLRLINYCLLFNSLECQGDKVIRGEIEEVPHFPYEPATDDTPYAYYPQTEEEETLFNYVLDLAGCGTLPITRTARAEPLTCSNSTAFEVPIQPVTSITEALIRDRGEYGGFYTAEALGHLSDVLRAPDSLYTHFYDPCNPPRQSQEGCDPGLWRVAAGPATVALMATFYDLPAEWNPYGPSGNPQEEYPGQVRDSLRNRIVLNALVDLLSSMEKLVVTGHNHMWIENPGFRLDYSAYTCQKVCADLPEPVAGAWYRTLKRGLDFLFADSRGYRSSDTDPYPRHDNTASSETDKAILGPQFANHMLPLARQYGTAKDINHIRQIRDEWTRLLVDMKSRSEAEFQEYTYKEGEAKGFLTSGTCLMDGTIVASYQGHCENFAGELFAAAMAEGDLPYAARVENTLRQAAKLAYDLSLIDHRFSGIKSYTSDQSISGRRTKPNPFPQRSLRIQHYLTGRVGPEYARFLWPQVWQDLSAQVPNDATSFDDAVQGAFDAFEPRIQKDLLNASDTMTGTRHYTRAMELALRPPQYAQNEWGNWWHANVVEHMVNPPRVETIQGDPNLILYPVQKVTPAFRVQALGDPGEEDFYVVDQRNPQTGFGYYATFYTGVSFRQTGFDHKGAGGSGIGAFAVAVPPPEDAIMPGRRVAVPIKGGYVGDIGRTSEDGLCVLPGTAWFIITTTVSPAGTRRSDCAYLWPAGQYDWRAWPVHAVWAVQPDQMVSFQTVAEDVYSSVYYNTAEARMTKPLPTTAVLTTMTPISYTFGYRSGASWQDALGCQYGGQGGCVHRRYTFYPDRMFVETRVTGADHDAYLDTAVVFETLPVYFGFKYEYPLSHTVPYEGKVVPAAPTRDDLAAHFGKVVQFYGLSDENLAPDRSGRITGVARIRIYQDVEDLVLPEPNQREQSPTFQKNDVRSRAADLQHKLAGIEIRFRSPAGQLRTTTVWTNTLPVLPPGYTGVMGSAGDRLWQFYKNLLVEIPRSEQTGEFALSYEMVPYREDRACAALWGDVDCSCRVDVGDLQAVAGHWRQAAEPPYDLNWDGKVDIADIMQVMSRWGERCLRRIY
ncbi:MAG: hypothetical protein D6791_10145 [Chloroflexi bacterium]|nr:MAG: hypothetical protein D6791_10145 [Chloroflexota bacterium]